MTRPNHPLPLAVRRQLLDRLYRDVLLVPPAAGGAAEEVAGDKNHKGHDNAPTAMGASVSESITSDPSDQLDQQGDDPCALYQRTPSPATATPCRAGETCRSG